MLTENAILINKNDIDIGTITEKSVLFDYTNLNIFTEIMNKINEELSEINDDIYVSARESIEPAVGGSRDIYYQKYLKYKMKYLKNKNMFIK